MQTMTRIHDPAKARAYFEDKLAFTTGPVELDRWIKARQDNLVVVDVRETLAGIEGEGQDHLRGAFSVAPDAVRLLTTWRNHSGRGHVQLAQLLLGERGAGCLPDLGGIQGVRHVRGAGW